MAQRGINKVILIGNLGADPEIRYTQNNVAVATLSLATSEAWKDKQTGEQREATEWHRVVVWDKLAEIAGQYLRKGSKVYVSGKLKTRKWTDQQGVERYTTEITLQGYDAELQMLDGPRDGQQQGGGGYQSQAQAQQQANPYLNGQGNTTPPQGNVQPAQQTRQQFQPRQAQQRSHDVTPNDGFPPIDFDDDIPF